MKRLFQIILFLGAVSLCNNSFAAVDGKGGQRFQEALSAKLADRQSKALQKKRTKKLSEIEKAQTPAALVKMLKSKTVSADQELKQRALSALKTQLKELSLDDFMKFEFNNQKFFQGQNLEDLFTRALANITDQMTVQGINQKIKSYEETLRGLKIGSKAYKATEYALETLTTIKNQKQDEEALKAQQKAAQEEKERQAKEKAAREKIESGKATEADYQLLLGMSVETDTEPIQYNNYATHEISTESAQEIFGNINTLEQYKFAERALDDLDTAFKGGFVNNGITNLSAVKELLKEKLVENLNKKNPNELTPAENTFLIDNDPQRKQEKAEKNRKVAQAIKQAQEDQLLTNYKEVLQEGGMDGTEITRQQQLVYIQKYKAALGTIDDIAWEAYRKHKPSDRMKTNVYYSVKDAKGYRDRFIDSFYNQIISNNDQGFLDIMLNHAQARDYFIQKLIASAQNIGGINGSGLTEEEQAELRKNIEAGFEAARFFFTIKNAKTEDEIQVALKEALSWEGGTDKFKEKIQKRADYQDFKIKVERVASDPGEIEKILRNYLKEDSSVNDVLNAGKFIKSLNPDKDLDNNIAKTLLEKLKEAVRNERRTIKELRGQGFDMSRLRQRKIFDEAAKFFPETYDTDVSDVLTGELQQGHIIVNSTSQDSLDALNQGVAQQGQDNMSIVEAQVNDSQTQSHAVVEQPVTDPIQPTQSDTKPSVQGSDNRGSDTTSGTGDDSTAQEHHEQELDDDQDHGGEGSKGSDELGFGDE